jgi:hypothetical protein
LPFGNHVRSSSLDGARGPTFNPTLRRNFVRSARSDPKRLRDAVRLSTLARRLGEAVNDRPEKIGEHGAFSVMISTSASMPGTNFCAISRGESSTVR